MPTRPHGIRADEADGVTRLRDGTQTGGSSVIEVSNLHFGVDLPAELFQRPGLVGAINSPISARVESP